MLEALAPPSSTTQSPSPLLAHASSEVTCGSSCKRLDKTPEAFVVAQLPASDQPGRCLPPHLQLAHTITQPAPFPNNHSGTLTTRRSSFRPSMDRSLSSFLPSSGSTNPQQSIFPVPSRTPPPATLDPLPSGALLPPQPTTHKQSFEVPPRNPSITHVTDCSPLIRLATMTDDLGFHSPYYNLRRKVNCVL